MRARVVFVSYAHEDIDVRTRLDVVLRPLVRKGRLEVWADDRIGVAQVWRDEIEDNLRRADLAVLLVSADFLASDYIMDVELPRLVERGVPLVCVPVGPSRWNDVEAIAAVQWPLPPERPLSTMRRDERDAALVRVSNAVAELAAGLGDAAIDHPPVLASPSPEAAPLPAAGEIGPLIGVPALPPTYLARHGDLDELKDRLRLPGRGRSIGLHGRGGTGKSVLAAALCHDPETRSLFPDGLYWLSLGESPDIVAEQRRLVRQLGEEPTFSTPSDGLRHLSELLASRRCLLVVDDVWSTAAAVAFAATGAAGRVLYTTRDAAVLADVGAVGHAVDALDLAASLTFLEQATGPVAPAERSTVERVISQTGGVILALSLVVGVRRSGSSWPETAEALERLTGIFQNHAYADVFKSMRLAVDRLTPADAEQYRLLAVFPEDVAVPATTVARLWDLDDAVPTLWRFADAGLLAWDGGHVRFHDLQRAFLRFDADRPGALLHRQLLDGHWPSGGWAHLPDDEPYLWDHLLYHLEMAGEYQAMVAVVTSGRWLARRLHRDGAYLAEADVARAAAARPGDASVSRLLRVLGRWAGLFRRDLSLAATTATLISRWEGAAAGAEDLLRPVSLEPARPLPEPSAALRRTLSGHSGEVVALVLSADGRVLASAGQSGTVLRWDPATGAELAAIACGTGSVRSSAFSPDGQMLARPGRGGEVRLWDAETGAERAVLGGRRSSPTQDQRGRGRGRGFRDMAWPKQALAFSPDGGSLASAGRGKVRLWDTATGAKRAVLKVDMVQALAFSPDGGTLASAGYDGKVRLWDTATGTRRATLRGHTDIVEAVAFPPDGRTVASSDRDHMVRLWDAASGVERAVLKVDMVRALAFSPDGRILASAGLDRTIRLWDVATGAERHRLAGGPPPEPFRRRRRSLSSVAFSPDGRTLASAGTDSYVHLW